MSERVVLYQPRDRGTTMPLGLLALGSALEGAKVVIVDGRIEIAPEARVAELCREATCLGVTVRTGPPLHDALRVSVAARIAQPALKIVWGGPHATLLPESCLETRVVDACVLGAGEDALAACLDELRQGARPERSGAVMVAGKAAGHRPAAPNPPPEHSPEAEYGLLAVESYFEAKDRRSLDYVSSRGGRDPGDAWRSLPAARVVDDLMALHRRFSLWEAVFQDERFFADPSRADGIARGLIDAGRPFKWRVAASVEDVCALSCERLRLLGESGCRRLDVRLAPGTVPMGSARDQVLEAGQRLHEAGLPARFRFTVGGPHGEAGRVAAFTKTARALAIMDHRFETRLHAFVPYPGEVGAPPGPHRTLAGWAGIEEEAGLSPGEAKRLARVAFYLRESQRDRPSRFGQRLLRVAGQARVRLGLFGLPVERLAVDVSALLRTGTRRPLPSDE